MKMLEIHRRLLLAAIPGLALAGCSDIIGPPAAPKLYVLRPKVPAAAPGPKVNWALSIQVPDASAGLDTDRIAILRPPASMDYYADAAWSDHAPALIQSALLEAFERSGRIDAVAPDSDAVRADYILATDLRDFEARYAGADGAPVAVVRMGVRLVKSVNREIVGRTEVVHEVPAAENSVDAAVEALDAALAAALADIVAWTFATPRA
jgi:cholesterol transport system auxiliary component